VNSSLRVLRRVLRLAMEWGISTAAPRIKLRRSEHHPGRVVTREEEARYLSAASGLMADIAMVLMDTGMQPEENSRLRWESVRWSSGQYGTLQVTHGKTAACSAQQDYHDPRVRVVLERRWEAAKIPSDSWVWADRIAVSRLEDWCCLRIALSSSLRTIS
jgi:integrase